MTGHALAGLRRAVVAHLATRQVTRVVYGTIIGLALVVALEAHPPTSAVMVGLLVATAFSVALAELYSEWIGVRTREHHGPDQHERREIAVDVVAVWFGVAFPAVFFLCATLGWMEPHTAFVVARWTGLGLIAGYGFCAGRLSGASTLASLVQAATVAAIAAALIAFKAIVH